MKDEVDKIITGLSGVEGGDVEGIKKWVTMGLKTMVTAVEKTMTEMGDAVADDRKEREDMKKEMGDRMKRMEEIARNNEVKIEAERKARETERKRESVRDMEKKLEISNRQLKSWTLTMGRRKWTKHWTI
jgi:mevalonate kinase